MPTFRKKNLFNDTSVPQVVLRPGSSLNGPAHAVHARPSGPANYSNFTPIKQRKVSTALKALIVIAVIAAIVALGIHAFTQYAPITVTINGEEATIQGSDRVLGELAKSDIWGVSPGNYVAVDGSVLREGDGAPFSATVNENATDNASLHLEQGDVITLENGTDITEPYTEGEVSKAYPKVEQTGVGAIHLYTEGSVGEKVSRTGNESHITTDVVIKEPKDYKLVYYNADTKGDKVIALTFDDGPWDGSTQEILDILKENDAKATFFTVGKCIKGHEDLLKQMHADGHEIATHTYDHAQGSGQGVSLNLMSTNERREEVSKGLKAIEEAVGKNSVAANAFRAPGGNFNEETAADVSDLVTGEIGWNIDTEDWRRPGEKLIAKRIMSADSGEIVLMHDGGGDRSQTVAALKEALPALKDKGYTFITISELTSKYPHEQGNED